MVNLLQDFSRIGRKLTEQNLIYSNFGNISQRKDKKILITATGSMLDELTENDLIEVPLYDTSEADCKASCELLVHREIYKKTDAAAIIHAHSPFAIILSLISKRNKIESVLIEKEKIIGTIPIIEGESGSTELAKNAAEVLSNHKTCIIKNHGTIAKGIDIKDAYINITALEHITKILYYQMLYEKRN